MKILNISTYDFHGGAAQAAYRLHCGLRKIGQDSRMLVQTRTRDDHEVYVPRTRYNNLVSLIRSQLDSMPASAYSRKKRQPFSSSLVWGNKSKRVNLLSPDVVNLHWICDGFISIGDIAQIDAPLVWTFHDMWAFTGGCHYTEGCHKYESYCRACPQLGSEMDLDLSNFVWKRKYKKWKNINIVIVTPSNWLADCAKNSSLFKSNRIEVIPNGIDIERFKPIEKYLARKILNLPSNKKLILFGAIGAITDERKGFKYLKSAVEKLINRSGPDRVQLVVFGASEPINRIEIGSKVHYIGKIYDDFTLACLYSAADLFVSPSVMENLSCTVMESLACGTPCVAFEIGGMTDLIEHYRNGYLAKPCDSDDFAQGIEFILADRTRWELLSKASRQKVLDEFDIDKISIKYKSLYESLINNEIVSN